ncbi:MAG: hypothetical protein F6J87_02125 [Spirulina sp. SIO3F2]|nr:hypothetical protein [Spirulina sp. SIO3F2]
MVLNLPPQLPDNPCGFGFKTTWWALPTNDTNAVIATLQLQDAQPANWQTGIKYVYENDTSQQVVFVTSPVYGWTLITGLYLINQPDEIIQPLIQLSQIFGVALVFSTHRVVEYHLWAKAVSGSLVRGYGYSGESGETFWDKGAMTCEEKDLNFAFFDERSPEAEDDSYWERDDLNYPDEMCVMNIAHAWSVSPLDLDTYQPKEQLLGVLGSHTKLLTRNTNDLGC